MMKTIREEIKTMFSARDIAAHHTRYGHAVEATYYAASANNAEKRARAMIRQMHDIADPPEGAKWLTDEELNDEICAVEAAGKTGSNRWCELDAEIVARYVAGAAAR
jgi:hypothetical protein